MCLSFDTQRIYMEAKSVNNSRKIFKHHCIIFLPYYHEYSVTYVMLQNGFLALLLRADTLSMKFKDIALVTSNRSL